MMLTDDANNIHCCNFCMKLYATQTFQMCNFLYVAQSATSAGFASTQARFLYRVYLLEPKLSIVTSSQPEATEKLCLKNLHHSNAYV